MAGLIDVRALEVALREVGEIIEIHGDGSLDWSASLWVLACEMPLFCLATDWKISNWGVRMVFQTDYLDAHRRHQEDAETLFATSRLANADHLFGLAAECGLKRLMIAFGMQFDLTKNSPISRDDWKHANDIWARFESYRSGHARGVGYTLPSGNPFADWDVAERYANQSHFEGERVLGHKNGAESVTVLIRKAEEEGLL